MLTSHENDDEFIELKPIIIAFKKNIHRIVGSTIFISLILCLVLYIRPNMYTATVVVVPNIDQSSYSNNLAGGLSGIASLAGIDISGGGDELKTYLAIAKSRNFIRSIFNSDKFLKIIFPGRWDNQASHWKKTGWIDVLKLYVNKLPHELSETRRPSEEEMMERVLGKIFSIKPSDEDGTYHFSVTTRNAEASAIIANKIINNLNEFIRLDKELETKVYLKFLQDSLETSATVETRNTLLLIIEEQTKKLMLTAAESNFAFKVIDAALPPEKQSSPNRPVVVLSLGGVIFIFISAVFVVIELRKNEI